MRFFAVKGVWQRDVAVSFRQVLLMEQLDLGEMALEGFCERVRQHGHPVLPAFAIAHGNVMISPITIFHPQPHTFHQTQPCSLEHAGHETIDAGELGQHGSGFLPCADGGDTAGALGTFETLQLWTRLLQHVTIEKEQGV